MRKYLYSALIFTLFLCSCPFGSADFVSNVTNFTFQPDCTVYAYKDNLNHDGTQVADSQLHINMSWACFDPARDLNDLDEKDLQKLVAEFKANDALTLTFVEPVIQNNEYFTIKNPQFFATIKVAKATAEKNIVNVDLLRDEMVVTITSMDESMVTGKIITKSSLITLTAKFTAPILTVDQTKVAVANWHLLNGTQPKITPPPPGQPQNIKVTPLPKDPL